MADIGDSIIGAESGGDPYATNPNSSAAGPGQFIDSTWLGLINQYRPDLAQGKSQADILSLRNDPQLSREMTGLYAQNNAQALSSAGLPATPQNLYLAHFAGPQGAINILNAAPDTPAASVLGTAPTTANPFLKNMSIGQLRQWAAGKMQGASTQPGPPLNLAPQQQSSQPSRLMSGLSALGNIDQTKLKLAKQTAPNLFGGQDQTLPAPLQIPTSTPAAQAIRARLLASIFAKQMPQS